MPGVYDERAKKLDAALDRALGGVTVTSKCKSPGLATSLRLSLYHRAKKRGISNLRFRVKDSTVIIEQIAEPE